MYLVSFGTDQSIHAENLKCMCVCITPTLTNTAGAARRWALLATGGGERARKE